MNTQKLKCVIVGLGNQAFEHLEAAKNHPQLCIIGGVDKDVQRYQEAKKLVGELACFEDLEDLKSSELHFDAFIVALPHHVYKEIWSQITAFGKPILKEKPLGRNYQEAKDFMLEARKNGCYLQTAIQRRHHESYLHLASFIKEKQLEIDEVHAHLHLGKSDGGLTWRGSKQQAGGGALLDAGYHLVDLLLFLIGDFEIVSATMWSDDKADNGEDIEDRAWVFGCTAKTWVEIDTWVRGLPDDNGGYKKSELIVLKTNQGLVWANREGVWHNNSRIWSTQREWRDAMIKQLSRFAESVRVGHSPSQEDDVVWDQLPAMRKIEEAYRLSAHY